MFSECIKNTSFNEIGSRIEKSIPTSEKIDNILYRAIILEPLSFEDLTFLLNPKAWEFKDRIQMTAHRITLQRHGRVMRFYAPLYVSNECTNGCVYCGFNTLNNIRRVTLSVDEILKEADVIKGMGIEHLLIVSGENVETVGRDYLQNIATILSNKFSTVGIEVAPLDEDDYRELFSSGIDGVTCYQETYSPEVYKKYHRSGPKRDMVKRLNTLDRAGRAGMRFLGIGTLLGLSDYRVEAFFLARHARYLEKTYWKAQVFVSFPKIRPSESGFKPVCDVDDEKLLHMISVLRLFLPDATLVLSTRESEVFRDKAFFYGINQISAGSKTNPLGYSEKNILPKGKQFEVADRRTPHEIAEKLSDLGYDPVFKDWDRGFRG